MARPRLLRSPVEIDGLLEEVPPPPEGPHLFGLSEAQTKIKVGFVVIGRSPETLRDRHAAELNVAAMSDEDGKVLAASLKLYDANGDLIEIMNAAISEEDALRIAQAIMATIQLTPSK